MILNKKDAHFTGRNLFRSALPAFLVLFLSACSTTLPRHATETTGDYSLHAAENTREMNDKHLRNLSAPELIARGNRLFEKNNLPLARIHFLRAINLRPESPLGYVGLGNIFYQNGEFGRAATAYGRALEKDPENTSALIGSGGIARKEKNFEQAVDYFSRALRFSPRNPAILTELAITYDLIGKEALAEPIYLQVTELKPKDTAAFNNLGLNYLLQGKPTEAITAFHTALNLMPENRRARNNLAVAYALKGLEEESLSLFRDTVGKSAAYNNIGYLYALQGDWNRAERALDWALEIRPSYYEKAGKNKDMVRNRRMMKTDKAVEEGEK